MTPGPIQKQWFADLRSGKYPQGKLVLCSLDDNNNPVGYCCLGVYAFVTAGVEGIPRYGELALASPQGDYESCTLTNDLYPKLGLNGNKGAPLEDFAPDGTRLYSLTIMNDGEPEENIPSYTFEQIADHLEKYFDYYFTASK